MDADETVEMMEVRVVLERVRKRVVRESANVVLSERGEYCNRECQKGDWKLHKAK